MRKSAIFNLAGFALTLCLLIYSQKTHAQKSVTISGSDGSKTVQFTGISLDMSKKAFVTIDIKNESAAELFVEWYYKGPWPMHQVDAADVVPPLQSIKASQVFYRFGLSNSSPWYPVSRNAHYLPGNQAIHWRAFNYQDLQKVQVTVSWKNYGGASGTVTISQPYATGDYTFPDMDYNTLSKPFVDEMGQYVHDSWDMKLNNISELKPLAEEDIKMYVGASFNPMFSKYGGIIGGERFDSTGYFHVQKIKGKWWFIDPDGYLFWSLGATGIGSGSSTPTSGRQELFPTFNDEKGTELWPLLEKQISSAGDIDFYNMNIIRKYGDEYEKMHEAVSFGRAKQFGLNTAGAWSKYPKNVKHPYTYWIWYPFVDYFKNDKNQAVKMVDPFNSKTKQDITANISSVARDWGNDPWLVGAFVHNELDWEYEMNVPEMVLRMTNVKPARLEMEIRLKAKYSTIQDLNTAWGSNFNSFESINGNNTSNYKAAFINDMLDYLKHFAETYFSYVAGEMKKYFPNQLYIGERFKLNSFENKIVHNIAIRYCDVMSFNYYGFTLDNFAVQLEVDKPWIIGEYGTCTGTHGVWGGGSAYSVDHQAALLKKYVKSGLEHPNFVGVHWFQYNDQMVTGRPSNGENYRRGLVNITDQPYLPLWEAIKECSEKIYEWRTGEPLATGLIDFNVKKPVDIKIYPNPNDGDFYIETSNLNQTLLSIFTITGQKVYETRFNGFRNILLPESVNGVFLVKVENTGETITKRILIQ